MQDSYNEKLIGSFRTYPVIVWLRDTVVERRSLAGKLPLSCARRIADG